MDTGNDLLALAERAKASGSLLPTLYLTCGRQDGFYPDHERFLQSLAGLGIDAAFEHWDGVHDFPYFNEALRRTIERFSCKMLPSRYKNRGGKFLPVLLEV